MLIVGHRGARHEAPENTIPGFRHALGLGLKLVEFDVRMSADGHLVIIHDDSVDRTTTGTGKVAEMTLAELQALDARAAFPDWPEPCVIPSFAEGLDACRGFPIILVEIKKDTPELLDVIVPKTIEEIRRQGLESQARIISFDTQALEIAQRDAPEIKRHLIGDWNAEHFLEDAIRLEVVQIEAHHPTADRALVRRAREAGFSIGAWQTNTEEDLRSVLEMEPDVFSSDCPTYIRTLIGDRETTTIAS